MSARRPDRESLWDVGRKWLPWCLALIFGLTIGWTAFVARTVATSGKYDTLSEIAVVTVKDAAPAQPLIVVCAIFTVTTLDFAGGAAVVTYRFLSNKFLEPQKRRLQEEAEKRGFQQGVEQGEEARQRLWAGWNARRIEADKNGVPFDEEPPK